MPTHGKTGKVPRSDATGPFPLAPPPRRVRVLIAEDDQDVREALERLLRFDGYDVVALSNGAQLLDFFAPWVLGTGEPPADLILTDVRMPGFSGLEIVEGLRERGWTRPIILMTAFGDDAMRRRVSRMDGVTLVDKPFDPCSLESLLVRVHPKEP